MTLRELLFKLLDAGVDNLDSKVIFFQEGISAWGEESAVEADYCAISKMVIVCSFLFLTGRLQMFKDWW